MKLKHLSAFGLALFVCSALNNAVYVCPSSEAFLLISQTVLLRDRQTVTERAGGGGGGEKEKRTESQPARRTNWHKETRQTNWHRETRQTDKLA